MQRSTSTEPKVDAPRRSRWQPGRALVSVARRDRGIVLTIAVFLVLIASMVGYNVATTANQRDTALIVNITARQRTLVERYIKDVLLTLQGIQADPGPSRDVLIEHRDGLARRWQGGRAAGEHRRHGHDLRR